MLYKSGFALDKHGKLIHISEAVSGFNHGYTCPVCKQKLGARKGERNVDHFAHEAGCTHSGESPLHFVAKNRLFELIQSNGWRFQYEYYYSVFEGGYWKMNEDRGVLQRYKNYTSQEPYLLSPDNFELISPRIEKTVEDSRKRPDVLAKTKDGQIVAIEIYVTNKKSKQDIDKYKDESVACIEIDLHDLPFDASIPEIDIALKNTSRQSWLYIPSNLIQFTKSRQEFLSTKEASDFMSKTEPEHQNDTGLTVSEIEQVKQDPTSIVKKVENGRLGKPMSGIGAQVPSKLCSISSKAKRRVGRMVKIKFMQSYANYRVGELAVVSSEMAKNLFEKHIARRGWS